MDPHQSTKPDPGPHRSDKPVSVDAHHGKKLIETNMTVSFNERHGFYFEFQVTVSPSVCYCFTADQTLSHHFASGLVLFLLILFFRDCWDQRKIQNTKNHVLHKKTHILKGKFLSM
jgi:hypothetical protein